MRACVVQGGAAHVMCSYNAINGVPTCGDPNLLNGILRKQWNFTGFVVSDFDAWAWMLDYQHYVADYEEAAAVGINAGCDQEGGRTDAVDALPAAVAAGTVTRATVATAFRRLMGVRIGLGMFDPPAAVPHNYVKSDTSVLMSPAHLALARRAAREALCLYKNEPPLAAALQRQEQHQRQDEQQDKEEQQQEQQEQPAAAEAAPAARKALPLSAAALSAGRGLALIGSQADDYELLNGNYACGDADPTTKQNKKGLLGMEACPKSATVRDALAAALGAGKVAYAPGCEDALCVPAGRDFGAAVAAARAADAVVVMLGLTFKCASWIYPLSPNGTRLDGPYVRSLAMT